MKKSQKTKDNFIENISNFGMSKLFGAIRWVVIWGYCYFLLWFFVYYEKPDPKKNNDHYTINVNTYIKSFQVSIKNINILKEFMPYEGNGLKKYYINSFNEIKNIDLLYNNFIVSTISSKMLIPRWLCYMLRGSMLLVVVIVMLEYIS